jgi:DNA-binding FrmR family transcriptional regulator
VETTPQATGSGPPALRSGARPVVPGPPRGVNSTTDPWPPAGPAAAPGKLSRGYTADRDKWLKALQRVEGQVQGVSRMVEQDRYCIEVLDRISMANKALQTVALGLLSEHLAHCVAHAIDSSPNQMQSKLKEATEAIARMVRS